MASSAAFDLLNFEEVSRDLNQTEADLGFLRGRIDEHLVHTGHNPLTEPVIKPPALVTAFGTRERQRRRPSW